MTTEQMALPISPNSSQAQPQLLCFSGISSAENVAIQVMELYVQ